MSDKTLKVTDRRMFTPEGELRDEFRHLEEPASGTAAGPGTTETKPAAGGAASPEHPPSAPPPSAPPPAAPPTASPSESSAEAESRQPGAPSFLDLIGLLAEPASIYLREARNAPPQMAAQSLELARLHIELLTVLEDKTRGNLTAEEKAMLDDVVYQLRSGFVGLRG